MALFNSNEANIKAVITAEDRASSVIKGFGAKTIAVGSAIGNVVANYVNKGIAEMGDLVGQAVKRVDTLNNAKRTFSNMGFSVKEVNAATKKLTDSILGLPTPLDQAVQGMTLLTSATNNIGQSQKLFTAMNDAILGFGGSAEMVNNAILQLSQDLAGGTIKAQTWNSLLQSGLGPTLAAMARQMGITTKALKDGLSDGSISVDEFQKKLILLDEKGGGGLKSLKQIAKDSTNGIQTSIANAKTAVVRSLANVINSIGQANIARLINKIGDAFANSIKYLGSFTEGIIHLWKDVVIPFSKALTENLLKAWDYLKPSVLDLWDSISRKLAPALENLWRNVIKPLVEALGPIVGKGLVWALKEVLNVTKFLLDNAIVPLINFVSNNKEFLVPLIGAFIALKTAMFIGNAVDAFVIGINTLRLITIPSMVASLQALGAAFYAAFPYAAIGAFVAWFMQKMDQITNSYNKMYDNINKSNDVLRNNMKTLISDFKAGRITAEQEIKGLKAQAKLFDDQVKTSTTSGFWSSLAKKLPSFDVGGVVPGPIGSPQLAVVHGGETVIPVNKSGGAVNFIVNIGMYAGTEIEKRKIGRTLYSAYMESKS